MPRDYKHRGASRRKPRRKAAPGWVWLLAGLLVAPTRYAPTANLQRSRNRANLILGLMETQGYLSPEEATATYGLAWKDVRS